MSRAWPQAEVWLPPWVMDEPPPPGGVVWRAQGHAIGTHWRVALTVPSSLAAAGLEAQVQELLAQAVQEVCDRFSTWQPDSWTCRHAALPAGAASPTDPMLREVLGMTWWVHQASAGALHPGIGGLLSLWGYGPHAAPPAWPSPAQVAANRPTPLVAEDWQAMLQEHAPLRQPGGQTLDFSGIAKGYLVDLCWQRLSTAFGPHVLVEVGGEARGGGVRADGQPWWVDLEGPAWAPVRVALHGLSVATSGRSQTQALLRSPTGQRLMRHHTLDPRTGWPVAHGTHTVTVLHASAMAADAWATALQVLPPAQAWALARELGLMARWCGEGEVEEAAGLPLVRHAAGDGQAWCLHSPDWALGLDEA